MSKYEQQNLCRDICGSSIQCEETVKHLDVTFDDMVNFETHITNISKKTARQINVLFRLSNVLKKKIREKSRECHNQKPQPFPDTKWKRKVVAVMVPKP